MASDREVLAELTAQILADPTFSVEDARLIVIGHAAFQRYLKHTISERIVRRPFGQRPTLWQREADTFRDAYFRHDGIIGDVAKELAIGKTTAYRKARELGLLCQSRKLSVA